MTPQEREARLRAARRMQDDIYQGIGATDRPDVDGRGAERASRARSDARESATSMTRAGTQPLRDLLARDASDADEDDSAVMSKPKDDWNAPRDQSDPDRARRMASRGTPAGSGGVTGTMNRNSGQRPMKPKGGY
jgi:hypothetical protein